MAARDQPFQMEVRLPVPDSYPCGREKGMQLGRPNGEEGRDPLPRLPANKQPASPSDGQKGLAEMELERGALLEHSTSRLHHRAPGWKTRV